MVARELGTVGQPIGAHDSLDQDDIRLPHYPDGSNTATMKIHVIVVLLFILVAIEGCKSLIRTVIYGGDLRMAAVGQLPYVAIKVLNRLLHGPKPPFRRDQFGQYLYGRV